MSEKLNQQLEQQDLEAMADQLLAEDAAKRGRGLQIPQEAGR